MAIRYDYTPIRALMGLAQAAGMTVAEAKERAYEEQKLARQEEYKFRMDMLHQQQKLARDLQMWQMKFEAEKWKKQNQVTFDQNVMMRQMGFEHDMTIRFAEEDEKRKKEQQKIQAVKKAYEDEIITKQEADMLYAQYGIRLQPTEEPERPTDIKAMGEELGRYNVPEHDIKTAQARAASGQPIPFRAPEEPDKETMADIRKGYLDDFERGTKDWERVLGVRSERSAAIQKVLGELEAGGWVHGMTGVAMKFKNRQEAINHVLANIGRDWRKVAPEAIEIINRKWSGGKEGAEPITATNPKTGKQIISYDGGKTWRPL